LGIREFMRTPLPAASTTTVTLPRGSGDVGRVDPADALARMGGIEADYTGHTLVVAPGRLAAIERWFLRAGVFLLPVTYWWGTYDHYVLPKLLVARVLVVGLLILFLARTFVTGSLPIARTPLDLPLLAFVISALLSTFFAYNENVALFGTYSRYDGLLTIVTYAALFWLAVRTLRGADDARALMRVLLASGYLVAALAIIQSVLDSTAQGTVVPAFGTLGQQNVLGAFLALLCPLAYRELVDADAWSTRIVALNALAILGIALVLTLSRSAWLGTALAAVIVIAGSRRPVLRPRVVAAAIVLIGLGVVGLTVGRGFQLEQKIEARAVSVFDVNAWGPRPAIWRDSVKLIVSRPVFGYGPDNFGLVFPRFQADYLGQQVDKAHADSLQVAATQGLIGLAAYILVLAAFVRAFWRGRQRAGAVTIFAGWVAYQVTLQLNFSALAASLPFWIFAAAAMESWGATRRPSPPLKTSPPPLAGPVGPRERRFSAKRAFETFGEGQVGASIAIAALAVLAIVGTVFPYLADSRLQVAVAADADGRLDAARVAAAQANQLTPQESVYAVEVGNIAFERSDWASAADAYDAASRLGTYNPLVYRNLALAEINLGRFSDARAAAGKAVELDRFDPANRALLAGLQAGP
jgi:O-antigen ligase